MNDYDAAFAYTRELGWHLIPSRALTIRYTKYPKPKWRDDPNATYQQAIDDGYTERHARKIAYERTRRELPESRDGEGPPDRDRRGA